MKDIDQIRRENMVLLEREVGGVTAAAERIGMSQPQWSNLRNGALDSQTGKQRGMRKETARKIEGAFGKPPGWLDVSHGGLDEAAKFIDLEAHPDLAPIRRVLIEIKAGIEGCAVEMHEEEGLPIFFRRDWLSQRGFHAENLVAIRVTGQSMETSLWDGDLVVVNLNDTTLKDGEVFAFNHEGEAVVKRLRRDAGQWWLASDNPAPRYSQKLCTEDTRIIGRVVYKQSDVI